MGKPSLQLLLAPICQYSMLVRWARIVFSVYLESDMSY